ncbi:MAG: M20/M25/M40 family metallo-hydrolase [Chthonomonadaceae bacterium]|nr:M20/M25/M40 family metallo-hydrolase [Chthonomonadaceae bacterium]
MSLKDFIVHNRAKSLEELATLILIPSVSAKGEYLSECAEAVVALMRLHGLTAEVFPTENGPPLAFGTYTSPFPNAPTVLFYNHHDVQPAEPFDLWDSDPFTLRVTETQAFARGVADDKGHIVSRLLALDALRKEHGGELPFHVRFLTEGEEEVGSPHLGSWVKANAEKLKADYCIWEEGGVGENDEPSLYCGMRGIAYFELRIKTIAFDAHSGMGGSILPNAAWRLVWALNSLKNSEERILIEGHYDKARPADAYDLELLSRLPDTEPELCELYGIKPGEFLGGAMTSGIELRRRAVFEPTLTLCGFTGGWQGEGGKTVLPSTASAKIDFRLVPDQDPEEVFALLRKHFDTHGFSDIEIEYTGGQKPARVDPRHPLVRLAAETGEEVYGKPATIHPMVGGSGPMWWFSGFLGLPVIAPGIEYPGVRAHAPNENIRLVDFDLGTEHLVRLLQRLATPAV